MNHTTTALAATEVAEGAGLKAAMGSRKGIALGASRAGWAALARVALVVLLDARD
jgi:hypothetical protein